MRRCGCTAGSPSGCWRARTAAAPQARVSAWVDAAGKDLAHWQRTLADMRAAGAGDFATLTVGVEAVRKLAG